MRGAAQATPVPAPSGVPGFVLLEDGTVFPGECVGAGGSGVGEVVFTTGMGGYQECVTDPSFHAQVITFTYPQIGNYGVSERAMESDRVHAAGVIMRAATEGADASSAEQGWLSWLAERGVPAITGVDTRALVRHIRSAGALRGGIFAAGTSVAEAREQVLAEPAMDGRDLASAVGTRERVVFAPATGTIATAARPPRIVALDTGVKRSIVNNFTARGAEVHLYPSATPVQELLADEPDGVFLVPGPGDPAALDPIVQTIRTLLRHGMPVFGICLGHQLLARALGLGTFKLPFGHHGSNHPVKDVRDGRIAITSQNHGFAVRGTPGELLETEFGPARLTHFNLYDGTVEGIRLIDAKVGSVQYHPEAGPGPNDANGLFDEFLAELGGI